MYSNFNNFSDKVSYSDQLVNNNQLNSYNNGPVQKMDKNAVFNKVSSVPVKNNKDTKSKKDCVIF